MGKALAFYRRLGLAVPADADDAAARGGRAGRWAAAAVRHRGDDPLVPPGLAGGRTGGARIGLAFALADPAAVDAAYAELTAAGAHGELAPFDAFWGQRYAVLHDPDGNGVDLFAPLAQAGDGRERD